jgi:phosphomannomutase
MRHSSESLFKAVALGLIKEGAQIINLGLAPTPLVGFFIGLKKYDAGIIISASHNPSKYNALKLLKREENGIMQIGKAQGLNEIFQIAASLDDGSFKNISGIKNQLTIEAHAFKEYINYIKNHFQFKKPIKIACDFGNGMGGILMPDILKNFSNITADYFFLEPDGSFPNHEPNPHDEKNFKFLKEKLKTKQYDLGLFFDGDCDRVFLLDQTGKIIEADNLLTLLADFEIEQGAVIEKKLYYDLRATKSLKEILSEKGIICQRMPTGNPLIKQKLIFEGGFLGGEMSGHIMFKEHFCLDDGFYTAFKVLNIIDKKNKPLSELIKPYKKYFKIHEINIPLNQGAKKVLEKLDQTFKKLYPEAKFDYLDGITIEFEDWWFNIRASNTENLLRLNLEAKKSKLMKQKIKEIKEVIKKI